MELGWGSADPRNRFISREKYGETGRYASERGRERVQVDRFVGEDRDNSLGIIHYGYFSHANMLIT